MKYASQLIAFYSGDGTDDRGRTLAEIWTWDDEQLEYVHDYIQWLFPLAEASMFNSSAPILTADDIKQFRGNPELRCNLHKSFQRILSFYGLVLDETGAVAVISRARRTALRGLPALKADSQKWPLVRPAHTS
jgi:hypothetical protein